ncbi:hypothetical protein FB45DRAFT_69194 [Roridomyces roridus]|uniref:Uncharacterized protein n=1 Tax=Roridomyces roridus TaxID=1738132 RepID=A0AAD7FL86_9AGAR|nr:hypothetical protein FB45DRAFT_69194 [Roridomyces roridus]
MRLPRSFSRIPIFALGSRGISTLWIHGTVCTRSRSSASSKLDKLGKKDLQLCSPAPLNQVPHADPSTSSTSLLGVMGARPHRRFERSIQTHCEYRPALPFLRNLSKSMRPSWRKPGWMRGSSRCCTGRVLLTWDALASAVRSAFGCSSFLIFFLRTGGERFQGRCLL